MPNAVVVYVTRTGNARRIAESIASLMKTDDHVIVDKVNRNGLWGYLRAGYHASTRKATPIGDPGIDLSGADTVVMVQPIWASGIVPPLRTWLRAHESELRGKKLGLFTVCKGSDLGPIRSAFEKEFMKLTAFGGIKERDDEQVRSAAYVTFVDSLS